MASLEFSSTVLKSKFRGCIIGALVGDCLGTPFEFKDFDWDDDDCLKILTPSKQKLGEFMTNLISEGICLLIITSAKPHISVYFLLFNNFL